MNTDMKELEFKANIAAPKKKVWDTMLNMDTYKEWTGAAWPGSTYDGQWRKGTDIRFMGDDASGTLATVTELEPYERVTAQHIALLLKGGAEDRSSAHAQSWIGTTESYYFDERNGETNLTIKLRTAPEWEKMFRDDWPKALKKLKEISEN